MWNQASVLITGGTGFLGKSLVRLLLERYSDIGRIIVFSRDELKQYEMAQEFSVRNYPQVRFVLGDIRDEARLLQACAGVDYVIHAAALKQVPAAEQNPTEYIKTNVLGTENVVKAALACNVSRMVVVSTDKAVNPSGVYGATKLCAERVVTAACVPGSASQTKIGLVRFGNILGSYGSVLPFFIEKRKEGVLPITHKDMTRFSMSAREASDMVIEIMGKIVGGEIFVPKIPSFRVVELAEAVAPGSRRTFVGVRPGEKIHEELITETESLNTVDFGKYYVVLPPLKHNDSSLYATWEAAEWVPKGFKYASNTNPEFLSLTHLKQLTT